MLLELLSDFQISIPELGRIEARTLPVVLLTSNNSRELTEALKRRCLYLWLDYPTPEHELEIVRLHAPELPETVARRLVEVVAMVRELDLKKPPSIAESIDWARALLLLGADDITADVFRRRCRSSSSTAPTSTSWPSASASSSAWRRDLRRPAPGARATSCGARAWRSGPPSSSTPSRRWARSAGRSRCAFREALAATLAKSPEDRRIFDLVFERFFFRAAEERGDAPGRARARRRRGRGGAGGDGRRRADRLRRRCASRSRRAIRDGDESAMRDLARLAIAAFGRRGQGSGVLGVDVQRIRRSLGLRSEPGGPIREDSAEPRPEPLTRDQIRRFEQHLRRELERAQIERTQALPPSRPLNELDRALPSGPLQDLAAVHRVVDAAQAPPGHPGPRDARAQAPRPRRRAPHDARLAADGRRARRAASYRPRRPRRPEIYVLCDVSTCVTSRLGVLPERPARAARRVPQDALVRVRRADLRGHRRLRARALLQGGLRRDLQGRRRRRRVRLHRLRARLARVPRRWSRTTCTRARR